MTMSKMIGFPAVVLALAMAGACERQPVGPSSLVPTPQSAAAGLSAKSSGSTPHTTVFSDGISASGSLSGSISGTEGTPGSLRAVVSGNYRWIINIPADASCDGSETATLLEQGLIGSEISGLLTLDANERTSSGERVDFRMTDVAGADLTDRWEIRGHTTIAYPAVITGDTDAITVEVASARMGFKRNPRGKVAADEMITCAVAFIATITNP